MQKVELVCMINDFDKFGSNDVIGWINFSLKVNSIFCFLPNFSKICRTLVALECTGERRSVSRKLTSPSGTLCNRLRMTSRFQIPEYRSRRENFSVYFMLPFSHLSDATIARGHFKIVNRTFQSFKKVHSAPYLCTMRFQFFLPV